MQVPPVGRVRCLEALMAEVEAAPPPESLRHSVDTQDKIDTRFQGGIPYMEILQVQALSLWHEEPWDWRAMGEVAGVSFQCFIGGDACPMCLHHEARAHPGYCQRWPTAWGALQHSRRRVHARHVQCAGYHCAESCACVWVWAVTAIFAGGHRVLQASLQWHPRASM